MFDNLLFIHSYFRYPILILFLVSFFFLIQSYAGKRISDRFQKTHKILTILTDIQFLIAIFVYSFSPTVRTTFSDMRSAMKDRELRFFTFEHSVMMITVLIFFHIINSKAKKNHENVKLILQFLIFYGIILLLLGLAYPFSRPMFRGF